MPRLGQSLRDLNAQIVYENKLTPVKIGMGMKKCTEKENIPREGNCMHTKTSPHCLSDDPG